MRLWQAKIGLQSFVMRFSQAAHKVAQENSLLYGKFAMWSLVCKYVQNMSNRSNHVEASVEAKLHSQEKLIKGKAVGPCLDSDRDQFTVEGIL